MNTSSQISRRCAYEECKRSDPIEVILGHRQRQYRDENRRQAQHRLLAACRVVMSCVNCHLSVILRGFLRKLATRPCAFSV